MRRPGKIELAFLAGAGSDLGARVIEEARDLLEDELGTRPKLIEPPEKPCWVLCVGTAAKHVAGSKPQNCFFCAAPVWVSPSSQALKAMRPICFDCIGRIESPGDA